ncbi:hypothetical protein [Ornithinibacillus xuwenensis]|uniref:Portal protein n=1 Tax=Ornithinibacillus xuwenensis TaxID=3144668 RepID=A0ABU9XBY6_9BACI
MEQEEKVQDEVKSQVSATKVEEEYQEGLQYKRQMGFIDKWPEYERFKAGDQWPKATEKTKHLPRPVFNVIKYIQNHKVSTVMNENIKMIFTPQEHIEDEENEELKKAVEGADLFTRYSDTTWENVKQDRLNEEALESGSSLGTGIWHYYWDDSVEGGITQPYIGELCGETIDPINIFFGNPQQRDVQKQPYIIISSRDTVKSVRKQAKDNGVKEELILQIKSDNDTQDEGYDNAQIEVKGTDKTTILTKYWKEDGKVFFTKVCSSIVIKDKTDTELTLYPVAVMQYERRKKSIFGIGDTEGLIPNQKGINFLMAMQLLSVQLTGWPKLVYKTGAVNPRKINNDPSEPIEDSSPPGVEGVRYLVPGKVDKLAGELLEAFMDHTKTLASATDVSTGEVGSGDYNATAIMLLQKASGVPIESIKKRFYRAMEDVGNIWAEFWKTKYNTTRKINVEDDEGKLEARDFKGTEYKDTPMYLKIDIGPSSNYSEELMMASLDKLFDGQHITLEDYLEFAPQNVIPFKDRLLKRLEERGMTMAQLPPLPQAGGMPQVPQAQPMQQSALMPQSQPQQGGLDPQLQAMVDQFRQMLVESGHEAAQLDDLALLQLMQEIGQGGLSQGQPQQPMQQAPQQPNGMV